ncbi:flavin reductase family protein [Luteipulveratus mongoliensis]|uniref:Flavin reductase n=1 Tax=Luteipulveratus mongoliensis TaxID=571913 RepID=A0A0K1JK13_9MICO|nr:flavin reductase family protein [Luteipulveratus mongoliensis]AKU16915.1 flavin reductase [Luteipulveratus mongoliensis]
MDFRELRNAFGRFATGVTVVTCTTDDGEPHGATVNAFTAVSLEPALAQVTLGRSSKASQFLGDRPFAINVLAEDQLDVAWHFAGRPSDRPPTWVEGPAAPLLDGSATTISCQPWRTYDGGDHLIVIGEVDAVVVTAREPLLFFGGQYRYLNPHHEAAPGTHWGGSVDCPTSGWFDADSFRPLVQSSAC